MLEVGSGRRCFACLRCHGGCACGHGFRWRCAGPVHGLVSPSTAATEDAIGHLPAAEATHELGGTRLPALGFGLERNRSCRPGGGFILPRSSHRPRSLLDGSAPRRVSRLRAVAACGARSPQVRAAALGPFAGAPSLPRALQRPRLPRSGERVGGYLGGRAGRGFLLGQHTSGRSGASGCGHASAPGHDARGHGDCPHTPARAYRGNCPSELLRRQPHGQKNPPRRLGRGQAVALRGRVLAGRATAHRLRQPVNATGIAP
mmetsp:Transcript_65586/g.182358  ORF Transcript_65586/g.182358 Transcript_65586/m.182358 type:complete len:260 (-) Transcript_65586:676-1455(-)